MRGKPSSFGLQLMGLMVMVTIVLILWGVWSLTL